MIYLPRDWAGRLFRGHTDISGEGSRCIWPLRRGTGKSERVLGPSTKRRVELAGYDFRASVEKAADTSGKYVFHRTGA